MLWLTADEGGLAPPAENPEQLFADAVESIRAAGLRPGVDVCLALDVASSHFWRDGRYLRINAAPPGNRFGVGMTDYIPE